MKIMEKLNNLLSFSDFSGKSPKNDQKKTKRTDVGLDIIKESFRDDVEYTIVDKLRIKCNEIQNQYSMSRDDELHTQLQYFQTLIRRIDNDEELSERDNYEIKKLNN
jgi:hypothetical protein